MVFGDFDADGLDGLAILVIALRRFGVDVEPYVPSRLDEGHGLSLAAIETAVGRRRDPSSSRSTAGRAPRPRSRRAAARGIDVIVTDHHRVPPDAAACLCGRQSAPRRLALPGRAARRQRRRLQGGAAAPRRRCQAARTPRSISPTSRRSARSPTSPRSSARTGRSPVSGSSDCGRRHGPGIAALLERARIAPAAVDLDTIAFALAPRLNAAGRVGEALEAARLLLAVDADEAAVHADALEVANKTRRDLTVTRGRRGAGARGRRARPTGVDRPRPVAGRDRRARRGSPGGGPRPSRRRRGGARATRSVPRAGATARSISGRPSRSAPTCSRATAATPALPASSFRRTAGRRSSSGSRRSPRRPCRRIRGRSCASTSRSRRSTSTTGCYRDLGGLAPYGPGNPEPLVAVLGLTVTRVRLAADDHTSLTLRRDRDVLDGIAFGRADIAALVHEGDRIDVVARLSSRTFGGFESLQLEIRDAAPSGSHPEAAAILAGASAGARGDTGMTRSTKPRSPRARDPYGIGPIGFDDRPDRVRSSASSLIAIVTINLFNYELPFAGRPAATGTVTATAATAVPPRRRHHRASSSCPRRRRSSARSSTPRAATSGSRPTRRPGS